MQVQLVQPNARYKRGHRRPKHPFNIHAMPWQIVPFFIAPVVPGETMRKLSHLSRTVSDPIKDKLMGAHIEYSYFYVKHTDLDIAADLVEMHLDLNKDMGPLSSAAPDGPTFFAANGVNFVKKCLDQVVYWYFRDEGDAIARTIADYPAAKLNNLGWWQSMKLEDEAPASDHELPGDSPSIPTNIPAGFTDHYLQWERMIAGELTTATFEDYLATFGVRVPKNHDEEEKKPELLRHVRQWTYPTNTVEPTTGVPSSAWIWSSEHDASKDRFFKEPGFLFGVQVIRPKVYLKNITGSLVNHMLNAFNWLPATVQDLAFSSLREFPQGFGPYQNSTSGGDDYWFDVKDLFLYGEHFTNHALTEYSATAAIPLIEAGGINTEYPVLSDAQGLFVGVTDATRRIRTDGVVTVDIASSVHKDTSG